MYHVFKYRKQVNDDYITKYTIVDEIIDYTVFMMQFCDLFGLF